MTKSCGVALCGGVASAICKQDRTYNPPDLDLVSTQEGAIQMVSMISRFLLARSVHFRIFANSNNEYVPSPATAHFRIQCGFWVPICIFVLPPELFRFYRISEGYMLQLPKDIKNTAEKLSEKDGKPRILSTDWNDLDLEDNPISEETRAVVAGLPEDYPDLKSLGFPIISELHLSGKA